MIEKSLKLSTGETIKIYDGVFSENQKSKICLFFQGSFFKMGGSSTSFFESLSNTFLFSQYSEQDDKNCGIFDGKNIEKILKTDLKGLNRKRSWVICSTHLTPYGYHTDSPDEGVKTMLFYGNNEWDKSWGGETIFCNKDGEVELVTENKANRIVIFDSCLSHKPAPLTLQSKIHYRLTYACQFGK